MSLVAAFVWRKTPKLSISTFMYNNENIKIIVAPTQHLLPHTLRTFKKETKKIINNFIMELKTLSKLHSKIIIEYKIVFNVSFIPWMIASDESMFVYKYFLRAVTKLQKKIHHIKIKPQLRNKLKGKSLKHFKRELRKMDLVSRKKHTGYEYVLWMVALHATSETYKKKLDAMKQKLLDSIF